MADTEFKEFILYMLPDHPNCERLKSEMAMKNMLESTAFIHAATVSPRPAWLIGVPVLVRQQMEPASGGLDDDSAKPRTKRTAYRGKQAFAFVHNYSEPASFGGFVGSSTSGNEFDSVVYGYAKKGGGEGERMGGAAGAGVGGGAVAASLRGHSFNEHAYGHGVKGGGEARIASAAGMIGGPPAAPVQASGLRGGGRPRSGGQEEDDASGVGAAAQAYLDARSASDSMRVQYRGAGGAAAGYR